MLSMRQIEVFRAVMSAGTVTEASRMLGVSQPAISRLLRYTEDQIGVALFARQGGRLIPTDEAWTLYPQTERLFGELDDVRRVAEELRYFRTGRLRIAAIPSMGYGLLPFSVANFRRAYPDVNLSVETQRNYEIASRVAENKVDIGLLLGPPDFPNILSEELFVTELVCVIPKSHPLAGKASATWTDLVGIPTITLKRALPIGAAVHESMQAVGDPTVVIEVTESVVACAMAGAGARRGHRRRPDGRAHRRAQCGRALVRAAPADLGPGPDLAVATPVPADRPLHRPTARRHQGCRVQPGWKRRHAGSKLT